MKYLPMMNLHRQHFLSNGHMPKLCLNVRMNTLSEGKQADDETFLAMFRTIEARGAWRPWNNIPRQYLHPGDGYCYWKMTDDIRESIIINRAENNIDSVKN